MESKKKILQRRISFEWGMISLLSVALFFMLQILSIEAYEGNTIMNVNTASVSSTSTTVSATVVSDASMEVFKGTTNVQLIAIKLSNTGTEDLTLTDLNVPGIYSVKNEANTALYLGDTKIGAPTVIQYSKVYFDELNIKIPKGESVTLSVRGDILASTKRNSMAYKLSSPRDVIVRNASGAAVKVAVTPGSSILNIKPAASLLAEIIPNDVNEVAKGATNVQLIAVKVTNTGKEDLVINNITVPGNYAAADVANVVLYADDIKVGAPTNTKSVAATFNNLNIAIAKGKSVIFALKGDIPSTIKRSALTYRWMGTYNISAKDAAKNTAKVAIRSGNSVIKLIDADTAPSISQLHIVLTEKDVKAKVGEKGVILQEMKLDNELNTTAVIKIDSFEMQSSITGPAIATTNFDAMYLYLDGNEIGKGTGGNTKMSFGTILSVPANSSAMLTLRGDVSAGAALQSLKFKMNYESTVSAGELSTNTPTVVTGNYSTVKIQSSISDVPSRLPRPNVALSVVPNALTEVAKGATGVQLFSAKITNNSAEEVSVSGLGVLSSFSDKAIKNVSLYVDGTAMGNPNKTKTYEVIYNALDIKIASGKSVTVILKGDISSDIKFKALSFRPDSCQNIFIVKGTESGLKAKIKTSGKAYLYFIQ